MKIIRYSLYGFKPQYQSHHINDYYKEIDYSKIPEPMRYNIRKIQQKEFIFFREHKSDLRKGVWVFIDGYKDNQSLNHLKQKVPCWEAEIPDDTDCYDTNWEKMFKISDPEAKIFGVFIPERELNKITNIKRRKK